MNYLGPTVISQTKNESSLQTLRTCSLGIKTLWNQIWLKKFLTKWILDLTSHIDHFHYGLVASQAYLSLPTNDFHYYKGGYIVFFVFFPQGSLPTLGQVMFSITEVKQTLGQSAVSRVMNLWCTEIICPVSLPPT